MMHGPMNIGEEFIYRIGLLFIDYVGILNMEVVWYVRRCQMIVVDDKKGVPFETSVVTY